MNCCEICNFKVNKNIEIKKVNSSKRSNNNSQTKINTDYILNTEEIYLNNIHIEKYNNEKDTIEIIDYPEIKRKKKEIFPNKFFNDFLKISPKKLKNKKEIINFNDSIENKNDETKIFIDIDNINLEKSIKKNSEKKIKSQNVKNKIRKSKRKNTIDANFFHNKQKYIFQNYFKNMKESKINNPFLNVFLNSNHKKKENKTNLTYNQKNKNFSEKIESKEIIDNSSYVSSN